MAKLLFNLRGVPEDEADEIRVLLTENEIPYYETPPGNWGISLPGLWLEGSSQLEEANRLIDQYQRERVARSRAEYERLRGEGKAPTLLGNIRANLLQVILSLAAVAALIYLPLKMFG